MSVPAMIVCHCHGVTDREIRSAVHDGATTVDAVGACVDAGTGCGGCQPLIEALIDEEAPAAARRMLPLLEDVA